MVNKKLINAALSAELSARVVKLSCRTDDIKRLAKAVMVLAPGVSRPGLRLAHGDSGYPKVEQAAGACGGSGPIPNSLAVAVAPAGENKGEALWCSQSGD